MATFVAAASDLHSSIRLAAGCSRKLKMTMQRAGRVIGTVKFAKDIVDPELRALAAWPVAAGKKIAVHTRPVALVRGALVVEVGDMAWQRQLNPLSLFLLKNLTRPMGESIGKATGFRPPPT